MSDRSNHPIQKEIDAKLESGGVVDLTKHFPSPDNPGIEVPELIVAGGPGIVSKDTRLLVIRGNGAQLIGEVPPGGPGHRAVMRINRGNVVVEGIFFTAAKPPPPPQPPDPPPVPLPPPPIIHTDGIRLEGGGWRGRNVAIRDCTFTSLNRFSILISSGEALSVENCMFIGSGNSGKSANSAIRIQRFHPHQDYPVNVTIGKCFIGDGYDYGVAIQDLLTDGLNPHQITVRECYIDEARRSAIFVQNADGVTLESLVLEGHGAINSGQGDDSLIYLEQRDPESICIVRKCRFNGRSRWIMQLKGSKVRLEDNWIAGGYNPPGYLYHGHRKLNINGSDRDWGTQSLLLADGSMSEH